MNLLSDLQPHIFNVSMNEWITVYPYWQCERTGKELPGSVMLITRFTWVTPWMYAYV